MGQRPRTYDVDAANEALPVVRRLVERIVRASEALPDLEDQVRIARYRSARTGAGGAESDDREAKEAAFESAQRVLAEAAIELQAMGVQLKDARRGLVDFLSLRDGEMVELCWQLGEETVAHWHRIGEGFPGRKPL